MLLPNMSDVQMKLDSQTDTWILVTVPLLLLGGGLLAMYVLWPTSRAVFEWCVRLVGRKHLGDLTPMQKYEHEECVSTVHQERRYVHGRWVIGWVVVDEWGNGTSSWRRFRSVDAADSYAADDGLIREW